MSKQTKCGKVNKECRIRQSVTNQTKCGKVDKVWQSRQKCNEVEKGQQKRLFFVNFLSFSQKLTFEKKNIRLNFPQIKMNVNWFSIFTIDFLKCYVPYTYINMDIPSCFFGSKFIILRRLQFTTSFLS